MGGMDELDGSLAWEMATERPVRSTVRWPGGYVLYDEGAGVAKRGTVQPVNQGEPVLYPLEVTYTTRVEPTSIAHTFGEGKLSWKVPDISWQLRAKLKATLAGSGWVTIDGLLFCDPTGEPFFLRPFSAVHLAPGDLFDVSIDSDLHVYERPR